MIFKDLILCSHLILPPGLQQLHHLRFAVVEAWQGSFFFDLVVHFFSKGCHQCSFLDQVTVSDILEIQFSFLLLRFLFGSSLLSQAFFPFEDHSLPKRLNTSGSQFNSLSICLGYFLLRGAMKKECEFDSKHAVCSPFSC